MLKNTFFLDKKLLYLNVIVKSLVTSDGLVILIKAVTTGTGSQYWYNGKAFLSNLAKKTEKYVFCKKKLLYLNVKRKSLGTNDVHVILIKQLLAQQYCNSVSTLIL